MDFTLKTLWSTLSVCKNRVRQKLPVDLDVTMNTDEQTLTVSFDMGGRSEELDKEKVLWVFTGYTCACCGLRERELSGAMDSKKDASESFYNKYPILKAVEAGEDVRRIARMEMMLRNGDLLSMGLECSSEAEVHQFKVLVKSIVQSAMLVRLEKGGCMTRRSATSVVSERRQKKGARAAAEEADRHMQDLLEAIDNEEAAQKSSSQHKKNKRAKAKSKKRNVLQEISEDNHPSSNVADLPKEDMFEVSSSAEDNVPVQLNDTNYQAAISEGCEIAATILELPVEDMVEMCSDEEDDAAVQLNDTSCQASLSTVWEKARVDAGDWVKVGKGGKLEAKTHKLDMDSKVEHAHQGNSCIATSPASADLANCTNNCAECISNFAEGAIKSRTCLPVGDPSKGIADMTKDKATTSDASARTEALTETDAQAQASTSQGVANAHAFRDELQVVPQIGSDVDLGWPKNHIGDYEIDLTLPPTTPMIIMPIVVRASCQLTVASGMPAKARPLYEHKWGSKLCSKCISGAETLSEASTASFDDMHDSAEESMDIGSFVRCLSLHSNLIDGASV